MALAQFPTAFVVPGPVLRSVEPKPVVVHRPSPTCSATLPSRREFLELSLSACLAATLPEVKSAYDFAPAKDGKPYPLSDYSGKVTLFVNVASYCAFTPQYADLVSLHNTFQPSGFDVIASPCNQFGSQEPDDDANICEFVKKKFGARFLLLDKLSVNEDVSNPADPLYRFLRDDSPERTGERVLWNFEKFLVSSSGRVLRRYPPNIRPSSVEPDLQYALTHPNSPLPPRAV